MTEKYEKPEFESDEEKERYIQLVTTLKQEYINNMVTFLFVNSVMKTAGADQEYVDKVLSRLTEKFKHQVYIITGTENPMDHVNVEDDLDVQHILDSITSDAASQKIKGQDPILHAALNNVCDVFHDTLKKAFDSIYKNIRLYVVDRDE